MDKMRDTRHGCVLPRTTHLPWVVDENVFFAHFPNCSTRFYNPFSKLLVGIYFPIPCP